MPNIAASTINDIGAKQRTRFKELSFERCVMGFSFSFKKLLKYMDVEQIQECVAAFKEDVAKSIKEDLNDKLAIILSSNKLPQSDKGGITLRLEDPFGIMRDVILMNSTSTSFKKDDACQYAVSKLGITAEQFMAAIEAGTSKTPFTTVQVRESKGKED